jgi:single-stranded-DNA-specific exonuclease
MAQNVGKGSGRSQPGVNLGRAVQAAFDAGLLLSGGGHAMAAGLAIRPERIAELKAFLSEHLAGETAIAFAEDSLEIDALVTPTSAGRELWADFQRMDPFGPGNPEPLFAVSSVRVERPMAMKGGHVRCVLVGDGPVSLRAIAWRVEDTDLGRRLLAGDGTLHVVGRLKPDDWKGRDGVQFEIEDAADPRVCS